MKDKTNSCQDNAFNVKQKLFTAISCGKSLFFFFLHLGNGNLISKRQKPLSIEDRLITNENKNYVCLIKRKQKVS